MTQRINVKRMTVSFAALLAGALILGSPPPAANADDAAKVRQVAAEKLPHVPGKTITALLVSYEPGGKSPRHHHAGSVLAYILSGEIRSENSATGAAKVYKAGETFFEPPGSTHLISENASATEPASLLAIFIADDGAELTTFEE